MSQVKSSQVHHLLTLCVMMLLAACQPKNELLPQEVKTIEKSQFRTNSTIIENRINGSLSSPQSIGEANNESEVEIDQNLFSAAQTLKNVIASNSSVRDWIVSEAQSSGKEVVKMKDLISTFPQLASNFSMFNKKFNFRNYQYEIDFLAINASNAVKGNQTIVSPWFELHDDEATGEADIIFGWHLNTNNISEINLSENDVNGTDIPVIISTLSMISQIGVDEAPSDSNNERVLRSQGYRINFRYEASNHSEFNCQAYRYNIQTSSWNWIQNGSSFWEIASVHRRNVGTAQSSLKAFCPECNTNNATSNRVLFNTYERDWYASTKNLGSGVAFGSIANLGGRMKFSDEWYGFSPNATLPLINLVGIFNSTTPFRYGNWKGYLDLLAN